MSEEAQLEGLKRLALHYTGSEDPNALLAHSSFTQVKERKFEETQDEELAIALTIDALSKVTEEGASVTGWYAGSYTDDVWEDGKKTDQTVVKSRFVLEDGFTLIVDGDYSFAPFQPVTVGNMVVTKNLFEDTVSTRRGKGEQTFTVTETDLLIPDGLLENAEAPAYRTKKNGLVRGTNSNAFLTGEHTPNEGGSGIFVNEGNDNFPATVRFNAEDAHGNAYQVEITNDAFNQATGTNIEDPNTVRDLIEGRSFSAIGELDVLANLNQEREEQHGGNIVQAWENQTAPNSNGKRKLTKPFVSTAPNGETLTFQDLYETRDGALGAKATVKELGYKPTLKIGKRTFGEYTFGEGTFIVFDGIEPGRPAASKKASALAALLKNQTTLEA